ncbi:uncharacterized protein SPSC_06213 [Sporisorium scitamineum]|uniref:Phosphoglycerate mutase n=1 Tax=Sporisorium scitamineum TaxID=49012 RepID=A0A0F7S9F8_9BASI|nr:uncharacterized protein SPSC_06213 [Sporisorium scitamineum]CDW98044.1 hypothetical protein [Sporisorium scitamineum]
MEPPKPPPTQLRVLIVRHGETRENVERIIQGQLDTDLNDRGRLQASITGRFLTHLRIDRIIASPLKRAADTARAICDQQNSHYFSDSPLGLEFDDRLKERGFGVLEGKVYRGGATKPEDTEGIEKMEPFSERLAGFWNDLVTRTGEVGKGGRVETVVVVSHGAAISALMNQVLVPGRYCIVPPNVVPSRFWNCSITELYVPVITTWASSTVSPGDLSRKQHWSIRPIHLGVQGSQFVLDHELQKKLLSSAKLSSTTEAVDQLQAMVDKTEQEFERDPQGRAQLEADTIKAPDGSTVQNDIGYGKAVGVVAKWSNVDHLKELDAQPAPASANGDGGSNVNVDQLVR